MKIISVKVCVPAILLLLSGCGQSSKNTAAADEVNTEAAAEEVGDEVLPQDAEVSDAEAEQVEIEQKAMLQELLNKNGGEDEEMLRKRCTRKALKQLNDAYEYDDYDENSLALWDINGKPYSDLVMVVESINKVGPNTYQVQFNAMADDQVMETTLMEYKLAEENGQWKIDSYKKL